MVKREGERRRRIREGEWGFRAPVPIASVTWSVEVSPAQTQNGLADCSDEHQRGCLENPWRQRRREEGCAVCVRLWGWKGRGEPRTVAQTSLRGQSGTVVCCLGEQARLCAGPAGVRPVIDPSLRDRSQESKLLMASLVCLFHY